MRARGDPPPHGLRGRSEGRNFSNAIAGERCFFGISFWSGILGSFQGEGKGFCIFGEVVRAILVDVYEENLGLYCVGRRFHSYGALVFGGG